MRNLVWGTYRPAKDFRAVLERMQAAEVFGIDTAPNYGLGEVEASLGLLEAGRRSRIFTKVGYTSGDPSALRDFSRGSTYCYSEDYIRERIDLSYRTVLRSGQIFECVFLHNPEHVFEADPKSASAALRRVFLGFRTALDKGYCKTVGIASWSISPYSDRGFVLYEALERSGLSRMLGYWMYPVSILRRDLISAALFEESERVPGDWQLLASAPFAGGEALAILGPRFASIFGGNCDPVYQALSLPRAVSAIPVCGIGRLAHVDSLLQAFDQDAPSRECAERFVRMVDEQ